MKSFFSLFSLIIKIFFGKMANRYVSRYELLQTIAKRWNLRLYNYNVTWYRDDEFKFIIESFVAKRGSTGKRFNLYYLARSVAHLEGDTAECGVAEGIMSYLIYVATKRQERFHHVFDSFEGLSSPISSDMPHPSVPALKKGDYAVSEEQVRHNLGNDKNIRLYKGWIPERFMEIADRNFVFVHIDVDFYEPTLDSLRFFYSRTVPGGIIICDDYGYLNTPGAKRAMDEFLSDKPELIVKLDAGHAFIIKQ